MRTPQELWVPFQKAWLPDTNKALEMWHGYAYSMGRAAAKGQRVVNTNMYNEHARVVRCCVRIAARAAAIAPLDVCDLSFEWRGFDLWDADAGYLPGKWVTDGLRDAHVLRNDRRAIRFIQHRVIREWPRDAGLLLRIREVTDAVV